MYTYFSVLMLIFASINATLEQKFFKGIFEKHRMFLLNYKFVSRDTLFYKLCRSIPHECPAQKVGLPPMCKLNPLYFEWTVMQRKAEYFESQDEIIQMALACI